VIKPEDIPDELIEKLVRPRKSDDWKQQIADDLNVMIESGVVSPPCHFIAYPSGMPVMHEPGETIQVYPGKCSEPHHRHWKGETE